MRLWRALPDARGDVLSGQIHYLDDYLKTVTVPDPLFQHVLTIPGVRYTLGLTIYYEIGEIDRFASARRFASYCRLVPSLAQSDQTVRKGRGKKQGNHYLKWAFTQAANIAVRYYPPCRKFRDKHANRRSGSAFNALLFLYRQVLHKELEESIQAVRAKRPQRLPTVLSREEARRIIAAMEGVEQLVVQVLYGGGLRLMEGLRLRVKDIDFELNQIVIHDGKGQKSRRTMLPEAIQEPLQIHLQRVRILHQADLKKGYGRVVLPGALARKYPRAETEWGWQFVFPAKTMYREKESGKRRRHPIHPTQIQRALKRAVATAGIAKPAHCHTFRHYAA